MFVFAIVSSRPDYCNSLLYSITDRLMQRVQSVQNAAARLVTGARRSDHITPVLCQLPWPVQQRVDFKVIGLVFQFLTGQTPVYLADEFRLVSDSAWWSSAAFCQHPDLRGATDTKSFR